MRVGGAGALQSSEIETDEPVEPLLTEKMNIEEWTTDDVVAVAESRGEAESKTKPIRKTLKTTKESEEFNRKKKATRRRSKTHKKEKRKKGSRYTKHNT